MLSSEVLWLELFHLPAISCIVLLIPFVVQIFSVLSLVFVKYKNQKSKLYYCWRAGHLQLCNGSCNLLEGMI